MTSALDNSVGSTDFWTGCASGGGSVGSNPNGNCGNWAVGGDTGGLGGAGSVSAGSWMAIGNDGCTVTYRIVCVCIK